MEGVEVKGGVEGEGGGGGGGGGGGVEGEGVEEVWGGWRSGRGQRCVRLRGVIVNCIPFFYLFTDVESFSHFW